ncbi:hypothetical protein CXG81DRAFT_23358 [Caulochytrium protostelioides]|uniref:Uncharacterized protein n=1 Tax=Caulochytrium protostelioides TaxID=1555241 RepID=A0A4P9WVK5_9FUNG|nr:hypothetical protein CAUPRSCDRAFT_12884 [Caulochytrium protostelioides]RKP03945.1 hypothetical protein CXG81DRAFT_23358 [Caulochytrium protostelioides]|eukprot:RKP03945.1 hypothetical protein CXG81DRAFT_23358 [Caulochytrium protostelioides]
MAQGGIKPSEAAKQQLAKLKRKQATRRPVKGAREVKPKPKSQAHLKQMKFTAKLRARAIQETEKYAAGKAFATGKLTIMKKTGQTSLEAQRKETKEKPRAF